MGPLYRTTRFQDTIHQYSSLVVCSNRNESIFLTVTQRNRNPSQETGSGKDTESRNSRLLFPDISRTKKERKDTFNYRTLSTEPIHRETVFQDGDSQVCKTIDETQRLGCLHRSDRCILSRSDATSVQKVSSIRLRRSGLFNSLPAVGVAAVKRLPVLHHSADSIVFSFGPLSLFFENQETLNPA